MGEKKGADDPYVQTRIGDRGVVSIEIVGKEKKATDPLKVRLENMVAGDKLDSDVLAFLVHVTKKQGILRSNIREKKKKKKKKKVFVWSDFKTQSLNVYGKSKPVEEARQMIKGEVERLRQIEITESWQSCWVRKT